MLVTAKNHDLKQAVMVRAEPDDWCLRWCRYRRWKVSSAPANTASAV